MEVQKEVEGLRAEIAQVDKEDQLLDRYLAEMSQLRARSADNAEMLVRGVDAQRSPRGLLRSLGATEQTRGAIT